MDVEGILGLPPSLLQITEDQLPGTALTSDPSFVSFSPPLDHDDYLWGLENGEGVSDFFDNYDLGDLLQSWDHMWKWYSPHVWSGTVFSCTYNGTVLVFMLNMDYFLLGAVCAMFENVMSQGKEMSHEPFYPKHITLWVFFFFLEIVISGFKSDLKLEHFENTEDLRNNSMHLLILKHAESQSSP